MQKTLRAILTCIALASAPALAPAADSSPSGAESATFIERYTNAAQDVILRGLQLIGIRYRLGGNDEDSGLDCSGFVRLVFKDTLGMLLPRSARGMSEVGQQVDARDLKPGDLVFFNTMRRAFSHVGIYLGDHHFLHAPRPGAEIRVESMQNSYWLNRYNGARRVIN